MSWFLDSNDTLLRSSREVYDGRYYKADYIEFNWETNGGWIDVGLPAYTDTTWYIDYSIEESVADNWIAGGANLSEQVAEIVGTLDGSSWFTGHGATYNKSYAVGVKTRGTLNADGIHRTYPYNIYIGCLNWATDSDNPITYNPSHFKVYEFAMSRAGVTQLQMYPAYDPVNQEWGMFDTVSNTFFGNAGAEGTSIAGGYYPAAVIQTPEVLAFDYDDPPTSMWYLNHEEIIVNGLLPEPLIDDQGAFNKCTHLVEVEIPASVTSIGRYSFRETQLKKVKISSNCTYYDTSFPDDCVISFYPS